MNKQKEKETLTIFKCRECEDPNHLGERKSFLSFEKFKGHCSDEHEIEHSKTEDNFLLQQYHNNKRNRERNPRREMLIKFWWKLQCKNKECSEKKIFSSNNCNVTIEIEEERLCLEKKNFFHIKCKECEKNCSYINKKILEDYIMDLAFQKLIYWTNEDKFPREENIEERRGGSLSRKPHIERLCDKCKKSGRNCREIIISSKKNYKKEEILKISEAEKEERGRGNDGTKINDESLFESRNNFLLLQIDEQ